MITLKYAERIDGELAERVLLLENIYGYTEEKNQIKLHINTLHEWGRNIHKDSTYRYEEVRNFIKSYFDTGENGVLFRVHVIRYEEPSDFTGEAGA